MNRRSLVHLLGTALLTAIFSAPALAQGQQDFSQVKIVTTQVGPNLYALDGQGGRMGVLVGSDGIFIVDSQFAPLSEKLIAAIRQISPAPFRFLVNTHVHGDHTGGNENFTKAGATLISRPMLRQRLAKPSAPPGGGAAPAPAPAAALAVLTYDSRSTVYMDGEAIELIPLPAAHTDGDTAVKFPSSDVLMTGDVFRSAGFPNIDRANGGSLNGLMDGLNTLIEAAGPNTKVLPGHGDITNRAGLIAHRDMAVVLRDRVQKAISSGQNQQQIVAAKLTKDYDEKTGNVAGSADRFIQQLYAELGGK
jgi:glyoxylase-like metal-dependent hydrolase (beta-lactamase superfamily II)